MTLVTQLSESPKRYRVIQWATGEVGQRTLRSIVDHPNLELAGVWVHSEEKEGSDAGTLAGIAPLGLAATRDIDALLASDADCVCYTSKDLFALDEVVLQIIRILEAGKDVVAVATSMGFPALLGSETMGRLSQACAAGGSTLYGGGISPDGVQDLLATLTTHARVESVEWAEMFDLRATTTR
jgi:4-hydroxy-tetrahydrodipicolinate reductase